MLNFPSVIIKSRIICIFIYFLAWFWTLVKLGINKGCLKSCMVQFHCFLSTWQKIISYKCVMIQIRSLFCILRNITLLFPTYSARAFVIIGVLRNKVEKKINEARISWNSDWKANFPAHNEEIMQIACIRV